MPPATLVLLIPGIAFFVCAVTAVFTLRDLGWQRYIPLATVVAWKLPHIAMLLHIRGFGMFFSLLCPLLTFVLIIYTLRTTWAGKRAVERILRILCLTYLFVIVGTLFLFPAT